MKACLRYQCMMNIRDMELVNILIKKTSKTRLLSWQSAHYTPVMRGIGIGGYSKRTKQVRLAPWPVITKATGQFFYQSVLSYVMRQKVW